LPIRGGKLSRYAAGRSCRFLAALDQDDDSPEILFLFQEMLQDGDRAEDRIPIVRPAAPVELAVGEARLPRPIALVPADHLRLLVEVAV